MRRSLGTVRDLLANLKPGFLLLTDLSGLESMATECAPYVGEIMDLCNEKEIKTIVRVVPDPQKDIGYNLISHFHHRSEVKTRTYDNLADAIESLSS